MCVLPGLESDKNGNECYNFYAAILKPVWLKV